MTTIIGLGHRQGVGKDTLGQILVKEHDFCRLAFADAIKASLYELAPLLDRCLADAIAELGIEEAKSRVPEVRKALVWGLPRGGRLLSGRFEVSYFRCVECGLVEHQPTPEDESHCSCPAWAECHCSCHPRAVVTNAGAVSSGQR